MTDSTVYSSLRGKNAKDIRTILLFLVLNAEPQIRTKEVKMRKRRRKPGPWLIEWKKVVGKIKLLSYRLGVPTYTNKTAEDYRDETKR